MPTDLDDFFKPAGPLPSLPEPAGPGALERLGPSPFPKSKFPFLGFLATVYEHLAGRAARRLGEDAPGAPEQP